MHILLGTLVVEIIILGIAAIIAFCIIRLFVSASIVFSRITFSLLFALGLESYYEFTDGKANTFIWAAIISLLIIGVVTLGVGSLVGGIFGKEFLITKGMEIVINILGVLMAVGALAEENEMADFEKFSNKTVIGAEKLIASLVYGATISFACMSNYGNWEFSGMVQLIIMLVGAVIAFFLDKVIIDIH